MIETFQQCGRVERLFGISRAGIGNTQVKERSQNVNQHDDGQRGNGRGGFCKMDQADQKGGNVRVDQRAAQNGSENDGTHCQSFDPAIGDDEFFGWQHFCQDAVFGRRVGGSAKPDDSVEIRG